MHHLRSLTLKHTLYALIFAFLITICFATLALALPGRDFLPLPYALTLELQGHSAYGPKMTAFFQEIYADTCKNCIDPAFAYPLPAIWFGLPMLGLPTVAARIVWCIISGGSIALGLRLLRLSPLWLLWLPMYLAVSAQQATVLLTGLLLIGFWAWKTERWWLLAAMVALTLPMKPQATLLPAGWFAWQVIRAGGWRKLLVCLAMVVLPTFVLEPTWPMAWAARVVSYSHALPSQSLLPWLLVVPLLWWLGQRWAALMLLQISLFPISFGYALLPLLLSYADMRSRRVAILGVLASWLMPFSVTQLPLLGLNQAWQNLLLIYPLTLLLAAWICRATPTPQPLEASAADAVY